MNDLLKAIAVTAELTGTEWSKDAARAVAEELSQYPLAQVKIALTECRKSLKGRLTLAEIINRIPSGHPGPEEAWAIVSRSMNNEQISIVWTDEMREAYGVACALADDPIAARMAFKESYGPLVSAARSNRQQPSWSVSLGYDVAGRELAVQEAVEKGRLSIEQASRLVPSLPPIATETLRLIAGVGK